MKKFREGICNAKWLLLFVIVIFVFAVVINECPFFYEYIKSTMKADSTQEISAWFGFLSGAGAASLTALAWFKFNGFYEQNQANILLRIDERWGSPEVIQARIIIHKLYIQIQKENKETLATLENEIHKRDDFIQDEIGKRIKELSDEIDKSNDFIHLLNFLDFMETIGYIESKGHVKAEELDALCGESLMFNYRIFECYIQYKRTQHESDEFYAHFDDLHSRLKDKVKLKEKPKSKPE